MPKIYIEINNKIDFTIEIYSDPISQLFYHQHQLLKQNDPDRARATIKDPNRYSIAYFDDLIQQARSQNIIDWTGNKLSSNPADHNQNQVCLNRLHKDIEVIQGLNNAQGLSNKQKELLNEMHDCLHALESIKNIADFYRHKPRSLIPFRYYPAKQELPLMPEPVKFTRRFEPGEIKTGFGYVGKEPMDCLLHNDNSLLQQTCKVIDRISLSWFLNVGEYTWTKWSDSPKWPENVDLALTEWYYKYKSDMDALGYNLQKILNHSGFCVVGKITDRQKIKYLRTTQSLQLTNYELQD